MQKVVTWIGLHLHADGQPEVRILTHRFPIKLARRYTNDGESSLLQIERFADD